MFLFQNVTRFSVHTKHTYYYVVTVIKILYVIVDFDQFQIFLIIHKLPYAGHQSGFRLQVFTCGLFTDAVISLDW